MKKINIKNIIFPEHASPVEGRKSYRVCLTKDLTYSFTNYKQVKTFLAELNRFLNNKMFEINDLYVEIFRLYRSHWHYLGPRTNTGIKRRITDIDKMLGFCYSKEHSNHYVFQFTNVVLSIFIEIIEILIESNLKRSNYLEIHKLKSLTSRIEFIRNEINNYEGGKEYLKGPSLESQGLGLNYKMKA